MSNIIPISLVKNILYEKINQYLREQIEIMSDELIGEIFDRSYNGQESPSNAVIALYLEDISELLAKYFYGKNLLDEKLEEFLTLNHGVEDVCDHVSDNKTYINRHLQKKCLRCDCYYNTSREKFFEEISKYI